MRLSVTQDSKQIHEIYNIYVIAVGLSEMYSLQYLQLTHRILQSLTDLFDS